MNLERTLLSIAMESGEVAAPELPMEYEPDANADIDEYLGLVNSHVDEIGRTVAVTQSLEALAKRYEGQEITPESMENYQFAMSQILHASGARIPVSVVAPSFEAADADKKTIGAKVKGVVESLLKWIQERFAALMAMFKRWGAKLGFGKKKLEERNEQAKADVAKLKEAKITTIGGKDKPAANESKPATKPAEPAAKAPEKKEETPAERLTAQNKKAAEASAGKPVKPFPSGATPEAKKTKAGIRVPGWMVSGGKLEIAKIRTYITQLNGGGSELGYLIAGKTASGSNLPAKETGEFMKGDPFNTAFKKFKETYPDGEYTTDYTATVDEVKTLIDAAFLQAKDLYVECMGLEQGMASSQRELTREINQNKGKDADHDRIAQLRKEAADDLAYWQALISFVNSVRNNADGVHALLTNMVK